MPLLCLIALVFPLTTFAGRTCDDWHAEIVSVEGTVEVQSADGWQEAKTGGRVCTGDSVRVKSYSRAAIRLPDKTVLRLDQDTSLTFSEPGDDTGSWVDLVRGIIHVISRDPRALRFNTPYANAGLEGTEFVIAVSGEETDVTVIEGEVALSNSAGAVGVASGQRGVARLARRPTAEPVADPVRAASWTPYHAPILDAPLPAADREPTPAEAQQAAFFSRRAARRLSLGRSEEARKDLDRALSLDPRHGEAFALRSLAALTEKRLDASLELAQTATDVSPREASAWLALSYAAEARGSLPQALAAAETAAELSPRHAFARARLAELQLARGDASSARTSAEAAAALRPDLAHAQTVLGFTELSGGTSERAAARFRAAISLDPAAPLPRLGLGLTLVRQGLLETGREQMEIAVVLDPTDALSRSYVAKIYETEHRGPLSASQLELAKDLRAEDPTPWFYDALRKQAENRPVEALHDLQAAIDLNDNHSVYRSRLLVDEDLASRSAGIGRLHTSLGFEQLALLQGWKSVAADPADYSGHRLLADVYAYLPRHQIARVNELFQSQLMQPLSMAPVRPQLADANLFILDTVGPSGLAFDEFRPLVRSNGLSFQGSAVVSAEDTQGADFTVAGLHDRVSYSVGRFDFETDGFRPNNDLDQQITSAYLQLRPNHATSVLTELRSTETTKGDLQLLFDPTAYGETTRQFESADSIRVGLRRDLSERGTLLTAVVAEELDNTLSVGEALQLFGDRTAYSLDTQYIYNGTRWQVRAGARHLTDRFDQETLATVTLPIPPFEATVSEQSRHELEYSAAYLYGDIELRDGLTAIVGGSLDSVAGVDLDRDRFNPKIGLIWEPSPRTTVRAVAFRTLQEPSVSKFTVRPSLEPTHVAGFNQQFFGSEGEVAWRYGAALDHRFSDDLYAGLELSRRDLEVPVAIVLPGASVPLLYQPEVQESVRRGYVYWTPSPDISASFAYQYEQFDNGGFGFSDGLTRVRTHRLPIELNYFHRSGFSAGATATYVDQAGEFSARQSGPDVVTEHGEDRFWVTDLSLSYRLPSRRGQVSLSVHNMFDEDFRFQDTDPENPRILPDRMALLKFTLSY